MKTKEQLFKEAFDENFQELRKLAAFGTHCHEIGLGQMGLKIHGIYNALHEQAALMYENSGHPKE